MAHALSLTDLGAALARTAAIAVMVAALAYPVPRPPLAGIPQAQRPGIAVPLAPPAERPRRLGGGGRVRLG